MANGIIEMKELKWNRNTGVGMTEGGNWTNEVVYILV